MVSKATENNWKRLGSGSEGKLTRRANKTQSQKRIAATSYLDSAPANLFLADVADMDCPVGDIMYSLCISYLRHSGILGKGHVKAFVSTLPCYECVDLEVPAGMWDEQKDVLGFIYQSLVAEGERNLTGQYYTNRKVVGCMVNGKVLEDGETFLDPCCGSGAFLLAVTTNTPSSLYGFDIDPVAVMIAGTNLLVKYAGHDFLPNVYCLDFLREDVRGYCERKGLPSRFDNIYTNPPWGTDKGGAYLKHYPEIRSKERSSMVVVAGLGRLDDGGELCCLLPTSLLKIKAHRDVRKYILSNSAIRRIDLFSERFDGVFTDYFSIKLSGIETERQEYDVTTGSGTEHISLSMADRSDGNIVIERLSAIDNLIVQKMESHRHDDLKHSQWALGIVTGDNRSTVKKECSSGMEPVYTGKQVAPFKLREPSSYILFDPKAFQQCAREEIYRAPEKLLYRFIAKYPIVAYDDRQCLCLNSANILIPRLDGISIKSVAALLNSALYRYYYSIRFADIKVLKGNLQALPFPELTKDEDSFLSDLVSCIHASDYSEEYQRMLDDMVFNLFGITPAEQAHVLARVG